MYNAIIFTCAKHSLFTTSFSIKNIPTSFEYHVYLKENIDALKTNNIALLKQLNPNNVPLEQIKRNLYDLVYSEIKENLFLKKEIILNEKVSFLIDDETNTPFLAKVEVPLPEHAYFFNFHKEGIVDCIDLKVHLVEATKYHFNKLKNYDTHHFELQHFTIRPRSYLNECVKIANKTFNNQDIPQYASKKSVIIPKATVSDIKKIDDYFEDLNTDVVDLALQNKCNEFRISEKSAFHFYNNGFREPSIMFQVKETVKNTSILIDNTIDLEKVVETFLF